MALEFVEFGISVCILHLSPGLAQISNQSADQVGSFLSQYMQTFEFLFADEALIACDVNM
jgi:hypothetical protein